MSTEEELPKSITPGDDGGNTTEEQRHETEELAVPVRPLSQTSISSPSTEESVTAFIERTVTSMTLRTSESTVTILPAPDSTLATPTIDTDLTKASLSDPITVSHDITKRAADQITRKKVTSQLETAPLYADSSDVEDLLDSSGVDAFPPIATTMAWDSAASPEFENEVRGESGHSDTEQEQYRTEVASTERQLTVKGRSVIRKYFTAATLVQLPAGHTTVAFNEDQVHTILRTITDESVISSYHTMKSLLHHAARGTPQDKKRSMPRRCAAPARQVHDSSGDEISLVGHITDGYTSGAIKSDEDPYQLGSISGTDGLSESDPAVRFPGTPLGLDPIAPRTEAITQLPGADTAVRPNLTIFIPKLA